VVVTGISGNLGTRLLRQLSAFRVIGVDMVPPTHASPAEFHRLDLGLESSCDAMIDILSRSGAAALVHLAFVIDPVRNGVLDPDRMWRINVAGTARVMEAITVANRSGRGAVNTFVFPSSVSAYGPNLVGAVKEDCPLAGHTLHYAIHKREADEVVRTRAGTLGNCHTFLLRPHIFTGATMQNYLVGALRGTATGRGRLAERLHQRGTRLPMLLPFGRRYLQNKIQFVHVDDMARLIAYIVERPHRTRGLTVLNVAGRGAPLTVSAAAQIANAKVQRLPSKLLVRAVLRTMWNLGISGFPPEAFPYLTGSYVMDTSRLREFLGDDYERVMQHTNADALADSFVPAKLGVVSAPEQRTSQAV
jgi:nucleoside-diphosphate-sugar epimerase